MNINQRQFDQLTEMGISLWQHKSTTVELHSSIKSTEKHQDKYIQPTESYLCGLLKQPVFTDILQCLELSIGEVSHKKDHLDLGLFNWYFTAEINNDISIECHNNNLITPNINLISQSPVLKKQLWQAIMKNLL